MRTWLVAAAVVAIFAVGALVGKTWTDGDDASAAGTWQLEVFDGFGYDLAAQEFVRTLGGDCQVSIAAVETAGGTKVLVAHACP